MSESHTVINTITDGSSTNASACSTNTVSTVGAVLPSRSESRRPPPVTPQRRNISRAAAAAGSCDGSSTSLSAAILTDSVAVSAQQHLPPPYTVPLIPYTPQDGHHQQQRPGVLAECAVSSVTCTVATSCHQRQLGSEGRRLGRRARSCRHHVTCHRSRQPCTRQDCRLPAMITRHHHRHHMPYATESGGGVKSCCNFMVARSVSVRWFVVMIALVGLSCAVVGTVLGALKTTGRDHLTVSLLMIGVGIVLISVSAVAWRLTAADSPSCRALFGLSANDATLTDDVIGGDVTSVMAAVLTSSGRRFAQRVVPGYGRAHHPYAAMVYPEFQYRPPPPSYHASMQAYRLALLLQDQQQQQQQQQQPRHAGGAISTAHGVTSSCTMSPPPSYFRAIAARTGGVHDTMCSGVSQRSIVSHPPSYHSRQSSMITTNQQQAPNNTAQYSPEHSGSICVSPVQTVVGRSPLDGAHNRELVSVVHTGSSSPPHDDTLVLAVSGTRTSDPVTCCDPPMTSPSSSRSCHDDVVVVSCRHVPVSCASDDQVTGGAVKISAACLDDQVTTGGSVVDETRGKFVRHINTATSTTSSSSSPSSELSSRHDHDAVVVMPLDQFKSAAGGGGEVQILAHL